jgi:tetratricopeptide (TPR) repeat protein
MLGNVFHCMVHSVKDIVVALMVTLELDAGAVTEAVADCQRAMRYDPDNAQVHALLAELRAGDQADDIDALKQRAAARFKAGHHAAAAEAYHMLTAWPGMAAIDLAVANSNLALCLLHQGKHLASLEACEKVFQHVMSSPWSEISTVWQKDPSSVDAVAERERVLLTKTLARAAANLMHLRRYAQACNAYKDAAMLAHSVGNEQHASVLEADSKRADQLASDEHGSRDCS